MPTNRSPLKNKKPQNRQLEQRHNRRSDVRIHAFLLLATLAVYLQVREFDFVNYDDPEYVTGNSHVLQGLTGSGVIWAVRSGEAANWLPVTRLSHMLDVQLFGSDSGLHHLSNVLFHVLSALLLFAFLNRATQARAASAFVAMVFALHPLHVESVAWIAERKDVLSALFWFLTMYLYVRYAEQPTRSRYLPVLFSFCLGLMAKPMLVTLPLVLWLLDFWPLQRLAGKRRRFTRLIGDKLPLLAVASGVSVITYLVQQSSRAVKPFPIGLRVANAVLSYGIYIVKLFWPSKLAVFYPYPHEIYAWEAVLAGVGLVGVSLLVVRGFRSRPYLPVGWFWYLGTLVPVIGFVQVGAQARADRYMYIPMVGLLIMLAWGVRDLVKRWPQAKFAVSAVAVGACGCCAALTFVQLRYWRNSETLFAHALQVTQGNYVAHHNLGLAIADVPGRLPEAIEHYRAALAIQPESVETRSDLGSALAKSGHFEEALAEYETALRLAPDCAICSSNLAIARGQLAEELFHEGVALQKSGQAPQAIEQFRAAIRLAPDDAEAHNDLGVALASLGRTGEAIQEFRTAVRLRPDYGDASYNLRMALESKGSRIKSE